jgi:cellulose synthase/poly-beta-1,6-N-acetylglucosamine synthase-like glycosyltransferase
MPTVDLTLLGYFMGIVALYYFALFALSSFTSRRHATESRSGPLFVLVVPAHDEELVIGETLRSLTALDYERYLVLVMNDGSRDRTSELARAFESTGRVRVVDRPRELAGRGKGAVLNHAYEIVNRLVDEADPRQSGEGAPDLFGADPTDVVIGVMDADGQLDQHALAETAWLFRNRRVGGVQIGVTIANAGDGLLPRCQDIEFVGFSHLAQAARDRLGSVGLGGNGQFTRLSALRSLGRPPWTDCLTEDLDLGLSLTRLGWRIRFCSTAWVAQEGVRTIRAWLRQRTRWAQGHYQCWSHFPVLLTARRAPLIARLDLCIYLLFVVFVMFVTANLLFTVAGAAGWLWIDNEFLTFLPAGPVRNLALLILGLGPVVLLFVRYQQVSRKRFRVWELPAYGAVFVVYVYLWAIASVWAWLRLMSGRGGWSKTARVGSEASA